MAYVLSGLTAIGAVIAMVTQHDLYGYLLLIISALWRIVGELQEGKSA